jgi:predicted secreted hydrolase
MAATGTYKTAGSGETVKFRGTSRIDPEFTSNALTADQAGWDWFSLHCSDGRDLMIYLRRKADGSWEKESSGTIVESDGKSRHLHRSEFTIDVKGHWTSTRTGARYPARWQIDIPAAELQASLAPLLADQELMTPGSTGVTYYEGAVTGEGSSRGKPVVCEGYIEMTGYAEKMGSLF